MIRTLIQDLSEYFNSIENPSAKEQIISRQLNSGYFPITAVHRDDLAAIGFNIEKISDSDMEYLADKMSNDYKEQLFWKSMEVIASEILCFPKLK